MISILTFVPFVGALVLLMAGFRRAGARAVAIAFSLIPLALVLAIWAGFNPAGGLQFVERHPWLPSLGIEYFAGIDGMGLLMVLLSAMIVPFALLATGKDAERPPLYFALMLFLQTGLFGAFTALNFFHWFLFWELSLVPAFLLVKMWGGPGRTAAAYQFFVYTLVGSVAMLLAFLAIFAATRTFDFITLSEMARSGKLTSEVAANLNWPAVPKESLMTVLFAGVFLGFAVKVPLVPFHTWLPATYAEAPGAVSMVLTGAMSKMGVYGFLRILLPIFPEQMRAMLTPLLWMAVGTIVLSAFAATVQKDLKRIIAYSSINHLGYCLLGIFAVVKLTDGDVRGALERTTALNGVLLQMFNHGITASALFCFAGFIEARSGGSRGLDDFGGLRKAAPVFCGLMGITLFASLGLPGLNGFVGEFLIFKGVFGLTPWAAVVSTAGLLMTAVFLLTILQRVFSGPLEPQASAFNDLTVGERLIVAPAIVLMFVLGICPQLLVGMINATVMQVVVNLTW
jgi:NADH-quinone oxidoreductase subunit M